MKTPNGPFLGTQTFAVTLGLCAEQKRMRAEQGSGGNGRTLKRAMAAVYCVEAVVSALVVMGGVWRRVAMRPCHCAESIGPRRFKCCWPG